MHTYMHKPYVTLPCIYTYMHMYTRIHIQTLMHAYTHIYVHIYFK